jgi:hypothetical protein
MSISHFYLSGVEALDSSLSTYFLSDEFTELHPAWIGEVLVKPKLEKTKMHQYGTAIGAAMRASHPRRYAYQHNFTS